MAEIGAAFLCADLGITNEAREDKKDRTEQTEYQKWRAQRDALRDETDALRGRTTRGVEEEGREGEKER